MLFNNTIGPQLLHNLSRQEVAPTLLPNLPRNKKRDDVLNYNIIRTNYCPYFAVDLLY